MTPDKRNPLGPTGEVVRANIARFRAGMQYKELAERLADLGRPIPTLGLRRIEAGERRVDVDDLVALAIALNVTPNALLMEPREDLEPANMTAAEGSTNVDAWAWLAGAGPLSLAGRVLYDLPGLDSSERYAVEAFRRRTSPLNIAADDDGESFRALQDEIRRGK